MIWEVDNLVSLDSEAFFMGETVDTPFGPKVLEVCKDGSTENNDWISVYEVSFPESQRQGINDLRRQLSDGSMELDETRDQDGDILCMTITEVFRRKQSAKNAQFLLACYTAVVPEYRGLGIGSIHRRKLGALLKSEYPDYLGIFSEIESTREEGVAPQAMKIRVRRKAFFMRLGLIPIDIDYLFPNYVSDGEPLHGELLWVPFQSEQVLPSALRTVLLRIYTEGYGLRPDDPLIARMLGSLPAANQR